MLPSMVEFNLNKFTQLTLHSYSLSGGVFWNFKLLAQFYIFTSSSKVLLKQVFENIFGSTFTAKLWRFENKISSWREYNCQGFEKISRLTNCIFTGAVK